MPSLPAHLSQNEAQGVVEGHPIAQFELGNLRNFVYLIIDWTARSAAIVDPWRDLTEPLEALERHGLKLERVFLTHTHHDHVGGVPELAARFPKLRFHAHASDTHRLEADLLSRIDPVVDGDRIAVGSLAVNVFFTPGHSAGECSFLVEGTPPYLLTGDTLFIRDCGRTDFATGSTTEMFASLRRIAGLAPETVILPGHHYALETASVLSRELETSPPLRCRSVEELEALP